MAHHTRINGSKRKKKETQALSFTVIYLPVPEDNANASSRVKSAIRGAALRKNSEAKNGYQVIVPLMPGLVTYGRTLQEAQEMAKDAIECHIEGLKKSGEPIPNERLALRGELRVALSA
jgi:antitoxin HicB